MKIHTNPFSGRADVTYKCQECGDEVGQDDAVWVDPHTGVATTGDAGRPYHVSCAPPEKEDEMGGEEIDDAFPEMKE